MQITINGQQFQTDKEILSDVLLDWGARPPVTVALNATFIPRHRHGETLLLPGDILDVLTPIQGG